MALRLSLGGVQDMRTAKKDKTVTLMVELSITPGTSEV